MHIDDYQTRSRLQLTLKSASSTLDMQKNDKSFQNTGKTYEDILNEVLQSDAKLTMAVTDKPIGNIIMQYQETNWEFVKRMASVFSAPVITNLNTVIPQITIGLSNIDKVHELKSPEFTSGNGGKNGAEIKLSLGSPGDSATGMQIKTEQYLFVGNTVSFNGATEKVKGISSKLEKGILMTAVQISKEADMVQPAVSNVQASGKMFTGIVQAVEKDKVQAHLCDIDQSYDGGGTHWFPYSTAYSSSDGSGFYCMPEIGDTVRVFFPSNNEGDAFAASSVNVSPLDNPKHKKWRTPGGKEILMTEEGMFITCKESKIFINLTDEDGISIQADKDINICSSTNMLLIAKDDIIVQAENNILLSTAESYISLTPETIEIGSDNVIIN